MRNEKLRGVFEDLGFGNVQTVITSGNVLFESAAKDVRALEMLIETALPERLGFTRATIIRSHAQLQRLVDAKPFGDIEDTLKSQLNVTFLKNLSGLKLKFPCRRQGKDYQLLDMHDRALCSVINCTTEKTAELMNWIERQFGKEVTMRTWKTVGRILTKMSGAD